jgi:hypothetical protein
MFNNKLIDWELDNGVFLPMIFDVPRNQFYDNVLRDKVQGRECIDVGFGTGLLSLLALKHGATHITAYEFTYERFQLGLHIIKSLGLTDKITLLNERFSDSTYAKFQDQNPVVFHEVIDYNIWKEGVAPLYSGPFELLPRTVGCDFYYVPLELHEYYKFSKRSEKEILWSDFYNAVKIDGWPEDPALSDIPALPEFVQQEITRRCRQIRSVVVKPNLTVDLEFGVELPQSYCNLIDSLSKEYFNNILTSPIESVALGAELDEYRALLRRGTKIANYEVSHNATTACPLIIDTKVNVPGTRGLILPEYYLRHDEHRLWVSPSDQNPKSHWTQPSMFEIMLISGPVSNLTLRTYTNTGEVRAFEDV